jgi:hypothetical protein
MYGSRRRILRRPQKRQIPRAAHQEDGFPIPQPTVRVPRGEQKVLKYSLDSSLPATWYSWKNGSADIAATGDLQIKLYDNFRDICR